MLSLPIQNSNIVTSLMQKIINTILKAAIAVLAMTLAASCIFEKENPIVKGGVKTVMVQFDVNSSGMVQTKAPIIEGDDEAEATEIKTLRVFAYTKKKVDNVETYSLCGFLYLTGEQIKAASTTALLMDIRLPYTQMKSEQTIYFRAVANAEGMTYKDTDGMPSVSVGRNEDGSMTMSENIGYDELDQITFGITNKVTDGITTQSFGNGMPMYCETHTTVNLNTQGTEVTDVPGHVSHTKLPEPIKVSLQLTRSLAKIEVYAAESTTETAVKSTNIKITGVSFANVPVSGKLFSPLSEMTYETEYASVELLNGGVVGKKVDSTDEDDIKVPTNYTNVASSFYLAENNQGADREYFCGTTDYAALTGDDATKATILRIAYTLGDDKTPKYGYVKMPKIQRNTCYKVLARIKANGEVALTLNVQEWTSGEIANVNFEDEVTLTNTGWTYGDGVENNNNTIVFGPASGLVATYEFTLNTPVGGTWYASLDGDIQNFVLETAGETEGSVITGKTVSGLITTGASYVKIKTTSSNAEQGQKIATFKLIAKTANGDRTLTVKFDSAKESYTLVQKQ